MRLHTLSGLGYTSSITCCRSGRMESRTKNFSGRKGTRSSSTSVRECYKKKLRGSTITNVAFPLLLALLAPPFLETVFGARSLFATALARWVSTFETIVIITYECIVLDCVQRPLPLHHRIIGLLASLAQRETTVKTNPAEVVAFT